MPTINEVIARVAEVRPDAYPDDVKGKWLCELEGTIWNEVIQTHRSWCCANPDYPKKYPEDGDKPLQVRPPYDRLYDLYLMAMIDFYNREYDNYNNSMIAYNDALDRWRREYHREHMPIQGHGIRGL